VNVCIVGAGGAIGAALCALYRRRGARVIAAGRDADRVRSEVAGDADLILELDVTRPPSLEPALAAHPEIDVLVYNAGQLDLATLAETTPELFEASWRANTLGAFVAARIAAPSMVARGSGCIAFLGATASLRGSPRTHAFASSKHALRGLAGSLARELGPRGVHVMHLVIDGKVWGDRTRARFPQATESDCLAPEAVATTLAALVDQPPSAWTFEMDLRPHHERWS
jgi:NAD(P)-dependent dehydrogenase (short-subunit alcohol dehydrogenase family)